MKEQSKIPTSKVERATKFIKTGAKLGSNYIKHYSKKAFQPELSRDELDNDNATAIYASLSELKGSALKVAQMMSMDKNLMPKAYTDKFALAQYSVSPLSYPLIVNTFQKSFGKSPAAMFDTFSQKAINAASIGQVHQATLNGKKLAVKIQYPGVADSVSADLKLVKPIALRILQLSEKDIDQYMEEVETRLLEETDYTLELKRSIAISKACSGLSNIYFPAYYPEQSSNRIITMDWLEGVHLKEFIKQNPSQELRNKVGQALWDFYDFQFHTLKAVHADPHPGNFLINEEGEVGIIDFGCIKEIPEEFYTPYFKLLNKEMVASQEDLEQIFHELLFLSPKDTLEEKKFFTGIFKDMINLLSKPFHYPTFDFGNEIYFKQIFEMGDKLGNMKALRNSKVARGSKHGLYVNRTYFGLYSILHELRANVDIQSLKLVA